jgi:hypothetical protein
MALVLFTPISKKALFVQKLLPMKTSLNIKVKLVLKMPVSGA